MSRLVYYRSAAQTLVADGQQTVDQAAGKGSPFDKDAADYLVATLAVAAQVLGELDRAQGELSVLVGKRDAQNERCNDLVANRKDDLFRYLGRPARDRVFRTAWFPNGAAVYKDPGPDQKAFALATLATLLVTRNHPRVPLEMREDIATELRAASAEMQVASTAAEAKQFELDLLETQYVASAREVRYQLGRLKNHWKDQGYTEAEIHTMIPHHPVKRAAKAGMAAQAAPLPRPEQAESGPASSAGNTSPESGSSS